MCGILGMIGNAPKKYSEEAFRLLSAIMRVSQIRGKDATGFSSVHFDEPGRLITESRPIESMRFVKRSSKFKALRRALPSVFIGHTRMTTSGNPKIGRNNHPFNNDRYSIVHNGTIKDWKDVVKDNGISMRSETDSEIILRIMERFDDPLTGIQTLVDTVPPESSMAIAALDYSLDTPRLVLFRNDGRPLFVLTSAAWKVLFFGSTKDILDTSLKAAFGSEYVKIKDKYSFEIAEVPSYQMIEIGFDVNQNPKRLRTSNVKKREIEVKKVFVSSHSTPTVKAGYGTYGEAAYNLPIVRPETKTYMDGLHMSIKESSSMISLIHNNKYMSKAELSHWKRWFNE